MADQIQCLIQYNFILSKPTPLVLMVMSLCFCVCLNQKDLLDGSTPRRSLNLKDRILSLAERSMKSFGG